MQASRRHQRTTHREQQIAQQRVAQELSTIEIGGGGGNFKIIVLLSA